MFLRNWSDGVSSMMAVLMRCGGIIMTSWLSFSPLSIPGGCDNASAGPFVLPGMCTILKLYSSRSVCQRACLRSSFLGAFQYVRFVWSVRIVKGSFVQAKYGHQWYSAFITASNSLL